MEQKIKELSLKIKKIIEEDIENSMEVLGLTPNEEAFYIEDLISQENFEKLSKEINTKNDYIKILKENVFNYYNAIISLKIVNNKLSLDIDKLSFEEQLKEISKTIEFFRIFKNNFLIKLNDETFDEIESILDSFEYWNKDDLMGWFYQFYNYGQKDMLTKSQIFTPDWVVRYMVDNSFELLDDPINAKILDPACGSGNFLVYIYEKLKNIYLDKGFSLEDSVKNILENNIYGIDIDERALQIAEFSLILKALEDGYQKKINLNLATPSDDNEEEKTLGSLLPNEKVNETKNVFHKILSKKYDLIIANPPYTDSSEYSEKLKNYIKKYYSDYKKNLYTCFIAKNETMIDKNGVITMITPQTFMYISSYENTRKLILNKLNIHKFVHFGLGGVFNYALVDTALYILTKKDISKSHFIDLTSVDKKKTKKNTLLNLNKNSDIIHDINQEIFKKIPGEKFVYWLKKDFYKIFKQKNLEEFCDIRQGIATGNNKKYLRYHWEIPRDQINFEGETSDKRWVPYVKGGPHRKWFGNYYWLISFDEKSKNELQKIGNHLPSKQYYFKEGITYTMTTSKGSTFRYLPKNMMFDCKGSSIFPKNNEDIFFFLGLLNSNLTTYILKFIAGSVDLEVGDLKKLPIPNITEKINLKKKIIKKSKKIYTLKKQNTEIFPEELYSSSFIKKLNGEHFEETFNNFIINKMKIDYQILIEESKLNDMILEIYELSDQKNILKKEFKDYIDTDIKNNSQLKLNYDISKLKSKLNENIARNFVNQGYNIHDLIKTSDKIDFSKNISLVKQYIFLVINEVISNLLKNEDVIGLTDKILLKELEKYHIDSFTTKDYYKKTIEEYLTKYFAKDHYKYFKKTPYLLNFAEPKTKFSVLVNLINFSKITPKKLDKVIDKYIIKLEENKKNTENIDNLIKYKTKLNIIFETYDLSKIHQTSNNFFDHFKTVLYF